MVTGNLATLPAHAQRAKLHPPTLIMVGEVVRLRERLAWFEDGAQPVEPETLRSTA